MPVILPLAVLLAAPPPLLDQFGHEQGLARHRGSAVVALVVTAKRLRAIKGWEVELKERLPDVGFLRVVDVPEKPPVTWERVAGKLRERVPREVPIGIDLERRWVAAYALDTAEVNVLVFGPDGQLAARFRGRRSKLLLDRVVAAAARVAPSGQDARR